jgi:hypothetical protein
MLDPEQFKRLNEKIHDATHPGTEFEYEELRDATDAELVEAYNKIAESAGMMGFLRLSLLLSELQRRDAERRDQRMMEMTDQMRGVTWIMGALTLINVLLVASQLL